MLKKLGWNRSKTLRADSWFHIQNCAKHPQRRFFFWLPDLNLQHLHGEVVSSSCTKKWFNELELSTNLWKKWVLENTPSILGLFWTFGGLQFYDTSVDSPWWTCFHSTNHHWGGIVTVLSPTKSLYPYHEVYIFQITVYILIQLDQFNASFID